MTVFIYNIFINLYIIEVGKRFSIHCFINFCYNMECTLAYYMVTYVNEINKVEHCRLVITN